MIRCALLKDHSGCLVCDRLEGSMTGFGETSQEAFLEIKASKVGSWVQNIGNGDGKEVIDLKKNEIRIPYIL